MRNWKSTQWYFGPKTEHRFLNQSFSTSPENDLDKRKGVLAIKNKRLVYPTIQILKAHLWYFSVGLVTFAFSDKEVSANMKYFKIRGFQHQSSFHENFSRLYGKILYIGSETSWQVGRVTSSTATYRKRISHYYPDYSDLRHHPDLCPYSDLRHHTDRPVPYSDLRNHPGVHRHPDLRHHNSTIIRNSTATLAALSSWYAHQYLKIISLRIIF